MATAAEERFSQAENDYAGPEPLPILQQLSQSIEYPVAAMGPRLERATQAIAKKAFAPVAMAANSVLSACSLAVQPHVNVLLPTDQIRPVSLFMVTIATTGDRKSTADDIAVSEILEYQRELNEQAKQQEVTNFARRTAWDAAKTAAISANKNQGREALEAALIALGAKPEDPMGGTITTRVGTVQGLLKEYVTSRPSLGLMSDEGGTWLGGYSMSEDNRLNTVTTLSDLWDGKPIQRLTGGEGMTTLYGRRLTFHMMIQPVLAGRLMGDVEFKGQGFLSRLLVTQPETLAGTRLVDPDAPEDEATNNDIASFHDRLCTIIRADMPMDPETRALKPRLLRFNETARRMWWAFYNSLEEQVGPGGELEDVRGFVGKLPEHAARIAAVLAMFEHGKNVKEIDAEILSNGITLAQFYLSEAMRLIGVASPDALEIHADTLVKWLNSSWTENLINIGAIQQRGPHVFKKLKSDQVRDVVGILVRNDHLSEKLVNGGMIKGKKVREAWRVQRILKP